MPTPARGTMSQVGRTTQLKIQITPELHRKIRVAAALKDMSMSKYLIELLDQQMKGVQLEALFK